MRLSEALEAPAQNATESGFATVRTARESPIPSITESCEILFYLYQIQHFAQLTLKERIMPA